MTIDRFREVLEAAGPPPDARELSEMLWLACHISPSGADAPPDPPVPPPQVSGEPANNPGLAAPPTRTPTPPPPPDPLRALHPRPAAGDEPAGEAEQVLVPTAPMLADPLGVQRALRPLKRRVPSRHRVELDEEATAARIADTRMWTPVLVPSPERWLSLSLVVDTGPTMRLWRPLARELAEALLRQGAFQDVHVSYLDATGRITSTPDAPPQDPGTLLDASGRQAVLVLSDCSGPHWWDGRAGRAVRRWARSGPTAILQPLAERLWRRTAAPASPGLAALPRPGAPNTDLRFAPYDGVAAPGVPVPVLEAAPRWFGAWARLVSGSEPQPAAVTTLPSRPSGTAPLHRERELPVAERVSRFLATASPDAAELAAHVAVSVPSLPVMRLIQHRILGGSGPGQLAEVLLSGLLRPAGGARYAFVPGAREALLDTLPRPEALHTRHVLEAVSAEIERRAGTSAETFRALLPAEGGPVTLTADTDHFALLTPETRTHLAPSATPPRRSAPALLDLLDAPAEALIGEWDRGPRSTVIGAGDDGTPARLDLLSGYAPLRDGMIIGPRAERDALLRTVVFSLALGHSPARLNFAFVDFSRGASFVGLGNLPHVTAAVHATSAESPLLAQLRAVLETEAARRGTLLRDSGVPTWLHHPAWTGDQEDAAAGNPPVPPALIVVVDNAGPLLDARPDLADAIVGLCGRGAAHGIQFVFCSPDDPPPSARLRDLARWLITTPGAGGTGTASLQDYGQGIVHEFRPAHLPLVDSDPIVEAMRRHGARADKLPWAEEPATPPAPSPPAPAAPRFDILRLNGGGRSGMFEETWTLPPFEPRDPAIGYDADGNVVTLYPLEMSAGIPHGLIVGEAEARQQVARNITLALAACYSPGDLTFVFAGLGEHPLGEPLDLPHVAFSDDELLGRPRRLRDLIDHLSEELDARDASARAASASADASRVLVVADVSLTFPSSRPEAAETLLSLAQRGRALGVQLLITSSTVENTTVWARFLPLFGWRIAANRLPPGVLQRVLGRADLPFPGERTAYLLAGGGSPRPLTMAQEPPEALVDDFVRRARHRWRALSAQAARRVPDPAVLDRVIAELDETVPDEEWTVDGGIEPIDGEKARAALREILGAHAEDLRAGRSRPHRHLIFPGPYTLEMTTAARLYGRALAELGVLSQGNLATMAYAESPWNDNSASVARLFGISRGSVVLVHDRPGQTPETGYLHHETISDLIRVMEEEHDDALVILCGDAARFRELRRAIPEFAERFRWVSALESDEPAAPDADDEAVVEVLRRLRVSEMRAERSGERRSRHLVYGGEDMPRIARMAAEYGRMLLGLEILAHGDVREATVDWSGHVAGEPGTTMTDLFRQSRGGVLLLHMSRVHDDGAADVTGPGFREELRALMQEHGEDPVVVLCADAGQMIGLRRSDPAFMGRFRRFTEFPVVRPRTGEPDRSGLGPDTAVHTGAPPGVTDERMMVGTESGTHEPVFVDFDTDRHLLITGPSGRRRAALLRLLIDGIASSGDDRRRLIYILDQQRRLRLPGDGPDMRYADTTETIVSLLDEAIWNARARLQTGRGADVYIFATGRRRLLEDDPMSRLVPMLEPSRPYGLHLVLSRDQFGFGEPADPLVRALREAGAPAVLMGYSGQEAELWSVPESLLGSLSPGRAVLARGDRHRLIELTRPS